jgi:hypothetical protein
MWFFKSGFGYLKIQKLANSRYGLYINDELVTSFHSPEAAAEATFTCKTGYEHWDNNGPVIMPEDLTDWQLQPT